MLIEERARAELRWKTLTTRSYSYDEKHPVEPTSDSSGDGEVEERREDLRSVSDEPRSLSKVRKDDGGVDECES